MSLGVSSGDLRIDRGGATESRREPPNLFGRGALQRSEKPSPITMRFRAFCVPMVYIGKRWALRRQAAKLLPKVTLDPQFEIKPRRRGAFVFFIPRVYASVKAE